MKFAAILSAALASIPAVTAAFHLHSEVSDNMVDVGDADIFRALWVRMYDVSDFRGGGTTVTGHQGTQGCYGQTIGPPTLDVQFVLEGQWGAVANLNGWHIRDIMIESMWKTAQVFMNRETYNVWRGCRGFSAQEGVSSRTDVACGPRGHMRCPNDNIGKCKGYPYLSCTGHAFGHRIPASIRVTIYNANGSLRPDYYHATISSTAREVKKGECGKVGAVASILAGFLPYGGIFQKGISIGCA